MNVALLLAVLIGAACFAVGLAVGGARVLAFAGGALSVLVAGLFAWLVLAYVLGR